MLPIVVGSLMSCVEGGCVPPILPERNQAVLVRYPCCCLSDRQKIFYEDIMLLLRFFFAVPENELSHA